MPNAPKNRHDTPLMELRGVGPERAAQLGRLELHTVGDLLLHKPRRYEDRRRCKAISDLTLGENSFARGRIVALGLKRYRQGQKSVFEIILEDGTGRLHCRWWNLPYMQQYFKQGDDVLVYGALNSLKPRTIDHPETEVIEGAEEISVHLNRIVPVYPLTEGLPQRWLRFLIWRTLLEYEKDIHEPHKDLDLGDLPSRTEAIRALHFPDEIRDGEKARQRLAFDEFLDLQIKMQSRRRTLLAKAQGLPCSGDKRLIKPFVASLPFKLTEAQAHVLRELRQNLGGGRPMRRLLQGDVGSGKTLVAACCALMAIECGFNVVLMAPTEILAEQHYRTFSQWFGRLGIQVVLRTGTHRGSMDQPAGPHDATQSLPNRPEAALVIGTHALIDSNFKLDKLGLVIIDEQHKFGVVQREQLLRKGTYPHLLVMTATPIPRTLGLTLYGDLDISVIDQLPPGRGHIKTYVRSSEKLPKVWEFLRGQLGEGRQAYVVHPRVEDTGQGDLKAVTREWQNLKHALQPYAVGLLHGRLRADERERVMHDFARNALRVLLTTSVIEVGVDVPNATVMVIENADSFGLAQLHQLRGRIGRGGHNSHCILIADAKTEDSKQRLQVLAETGDGFRIAEADLQRRGAGEFLGQAQSGLPPFRFGNLTEDRELIERARRCAVELLDKQREPAGPRAD